MKRPRDTHQVRQIIDTLTQETAIAADLRRSLRRRTRRGDHERDEQIHRQLYRLAQAMVSVRSEIARSAWHDVAGGLEPELRAASAAAQYERQQLRKLLV